MDRVADKHRQAYFFLAFFISTLLTCVLVTFIPGSLAYRCSKVIPLLLLCAARFRNHDEHIARYVGVGLFASFVGDAVIDTSFVAGLGSFLIGHLFYLLAMGWPSRTTGTLLSILPAALYCVFMYWLLVHSDRVPVPLRIPVTVYMLVISTMFGRAIGRAFIDSRDQAARIFFAGATLFILSDSLIGINRWVFPIPYASVCILSTYYAGQWLIFQGSKSKTTQ